MQNHSEKQKETTPSSLRILCDTTLIWYKFSFYEILFPIAMENTIEQNKLLMYGDDNLAEIF